MCRGICFLLLLLSPLLLLLLRGFRGSGRESGITGNSYWCTTAQNIIEGDDRKQKHTSSVNRLFISSNLPITGGAVSSTVILGRFVFLREKLKKSHQDVVCCFLFLVWINILGKSKGRWLLKFVLKDKDMIKLFISNMLIASRKWLLQLTLDLLTKNHSVINGN